MFPMGYSSAVKGLTLRLIAIHGGLNTLSSRRKGENEFAAQRTVHTS